jgi:hypothetical protein
MKRRFLSCVPVTDLPFCSGVSSLFKIQKQDQMVKILFDDILSYAVIPPEVGDREQKRRPYGAGAVTQ